MDGAIDATFAYRYQLIQHHQDDEIVTNRVQGSYPIGLLE